MAERPHVLIVDDSAAVTGALRVLFEETGHDVSIATSVREAVDLAAARSVDVMLLDLTLPDGDGLAALSAMRDRQVEPRVTAALTGHAEPEIAARCGMTHASVRVNLHRGMRQLRDRLGLAPAERRGPSPAIGSQRRRHLRQR